MAATVSTVTKGRSNEVWGTRFVSLFRITLDSSYPTGGEAVDFKQYGAQGEVQAVFISQHTPVATGYVFNYDKTNEKIVATWVDTTVDGAALAEVANTTDLSGVVLDVLVISK